VVAVGRGPGGVGRERAAQHRGAGETRGGADAGIAAVVVDQRRERRRGVRGRADRAAPAVRGGGGLIGGLREGALETRPPEVAARGLRDVDLLPGHPAHVADVERPGVGGGGIGAAGAGAHREAERIAHAVRPHPRAHRHRIAIPERIAREAVSSRGIDAQDLARETAQVRERNAPTSSSGSPARAGTTRDRVRPDQRRQVRTIADRHQQRAVAASAGAAGRFLVPTGGLAAQFVPIRTVREADPRVQSVALSV
jgi:hypothetical protein